MSQAEQQDDYLPGLVIRAVQVEVADASSADCAYFCHCDDGSEYAVKTAASRPYEPHSEWFCTRLGEMVGLASPPCRVVALPDGSGFGSRWESGHEPQNWWQRGMTGGLDLQRISPVLSRILAFDLFVHNEDRHLYNYIVRRQRSGLALLAFDYSRAWLFNGFPLPALPMSSTTNTVAAHRALKLAFGPFFVFSEADLVLRRLIAISPDVVRRIIREHPREWLPLELEQGILDWWSSDARINRIDSIRAGLIDGSYL